MEIKIKTSKAPQRTWNMCKRHFPPQLSLNRESEPFQGPHNPGCISLRLSSQGGDRMDKGDIESLNVPNVISHLLSHATKVSPAVVLVYGWATPLLSLSPDYCSHSCFVITKSLSPFTPSSPSGAEQNLINLKLAKQLGPCNLLTLPFLPGL